MKRSSRLIGHVGASCSPIRVGTRFVSILWILVALIPISAPAASFNCGDAKIPAEKFVCTNPTISKLDDDLDALYRRTLAKVSEDEKKQLIAQQRHWLSRTRNVCRKEVCFKHAYWMRQAELAFFFEPKSPLYAKEADKAEAVKMALATATLYPHGLSDPQFCGQILADLKEMRDISFVDPVVQTMSYEDPALDPWKERFCRKANSGKQFTFEYACGGNDLPPYDPIDIDTDLEHCHAGYGLPPFKIFELLPLVSSAKKRYFFYADDSYGPMNKQPHELPHFGGGMIGFREFRAGDCSGYHGAKYSHSDRDQRGGASYNSLIKYRQRYFFLILKRYMPNYYGLNIDFTDTNASCTWSSNK